MSIMRKAKTRAPSPARLSSSGKLAATQITGQTSKYLAETEKDLNKVLAAATSSSTTLIVDDADTLFGKRSPTKPR